MEAPLAFILGIHTDLLHEVDSCVYDGVILIDIDTGKITGDSVLKSLPPLPSKEVNNLYHSLYAALYPNLVYNEFSNEKEIEQYIFILLYLLLFLYIFIILLYFIVLYQIHLFTLNHLKKNKLKYKSEVPSSDSSLKV